MSQRFQTLPNRMSITRTPLGQLGLVLISALLGAFLLAMLVGSASAQEQEPENETGQTEARQRSETAIGRGFTGLATIGADGTSLAVRSKGVDFELFVTDLTDIKSPPDEGLTLSDLPTTPGFKIAGLADRPVTDSDGIPTLDPLTAVKIAVIPGKATRSHRRTIAAEKDGENLTILDEDGTKTDVEGRGADFEKGEAIVMLVQASRRGGVGQKVRGLFRAKIVDERLDRLSDAQTEDPLKIGILSDLRKKREDLHEERLQKTADNSGADFKDFVLTTVKAFKEKKEERRSRGGVGRIISECARSIAGNTARSVTDLDADQRQRVTDECLAPEKIEKAQSPAVRITSPSSRTVVAANDLVTVTAEAKDDVGVVSVTFSAAGIEIATLTDAPYAVDVPIPTGVSTVQVTAKALDADGRGGSDAITLRVARATDVGVKITSPVANVNAAGNPGGRSRRSTVSGSDESIAEGDTIRIRAEVTGTGTVTVVFTVGGVVQSPISSPPYTLSYFVPRTTTTDAPPLLEITAAATDGSGNTASDAVSVTVVRKVTVVNVKITEPGTTAKFAGGDTVVIKATTDDDSEIAFMTFSVDGTETVDNEAPFTHTYVVPGRSSAGPATSSGPPNAFVGAVTLDGKTAPDGTVVTAWIAGSDSTTLIIKATATANGGETGSASMSLPVSSTINAGEAKVKNGKYSLNAAQPSGQRFSGKTVTFTVGGKDARETATWRQGGVDAVDLTAN